MDISAIARTCQKKGIQIEKEEIKLSLFSDDIILLKEIPKDSTENLLELINEFGKVAQYKFYSPKSIVSVYKQQTTWKIMFFKNAIHTKNNKILTRKLTKEVKDLCSEN